MSAKTTAERQREYTARRKEEGLKEVRNLWCHPEDEPALRAYAAKLLRRRAKESPQRKGGS